MKITKRAKWSQEQKKQYWFVIQQLVSREVKRKYSRSYLGILWSVLNPLLSMVVISLVFSKMFDRNIEKFPIYYLTGSLIWHLFTNSTNAAMTTLVDNKAMLIKVKIPMEVLVMTRVGTALVNLGYSMIAYVLMLIVFQVRITWLVVFYPFVILCALLFSQGISYILSIAYVFFGDVKHLYSVFLMLLMYCSAIFYPVDRLPGYVYAFVIRNPVFNYIQCARKLVMWGQIPTGIEIARMVLWSIGSLVVGSIVFNLNKNKVMQKI